MKKQQLQNTFRQSPAAPKVKTSMGKRITQRLRVVLFGIPVPGVPEKPLTFKKITSLYPINVYRDEMRCHTWTVAVKTVQPDERFEEHAAWMQHILTEHGATIADIADLEHQECLHNIRAYKVIEIRNHNTVKTAKNNN